MTKVELLLRIDSGCETGHIFHDSTCDCPDQLLKTMEQVMNKGEGIIITIPLSGRVMVAIYDDRLEIQSAGMFPYGMTLTHFMSGVSHIRNRVIARIFRELGLIRPLRKLSL